MKFSGHETFPCRYAWLPKAAEALCADPALFINEEEAMVQLGLGKNMVRALKFWVQAGGVAETSKDAPRGRRAMTLTHLGQSVFVGHGAAKALDPFLEDIATLWLLHWKMATWVERLMAWSYLLFERPTAEFTKSDVVEQLLKKAQNAKRRATEVTIKQHFDVFLHTYVPTSGRKGEVREDNLDSPFSELALIARSGERRSEKGRREPIYAFSEGRKPEISNALFRYCVDDFWSQNHAEEKTLSLRQIQIGAGSPGLAFRLPEEDVRERLRELAKSAHGAYEFRESSMLDQLIRVRPSNQDLLAEIYAS